MLLQTRHQSAVSLLWSSLLSRAFTAFSDGVIRLPVHMLWEMKRNVYRWGGKLYVDFPALNYVLQISFCIWSDDGNTWPGTYLKFKLRGGVAPYICIGRH